jgi:hypothetical protein
MPRPRTVLTFVLPAVLAASMMAAQALPELADVILRGGRVITLDAAGRVAEAVAVKGNRILATGSTADVQTLAGPQTRVVDLKGRGMTAGFIDAHTHTEHTAEFLTFWVDADARQHRRPGHASELARDDSTPAVPIADCHGVQAAGQFRHHGNADRHDQSTDRNEFHYNGRMLLNGGTLNIESWHRYNEHARAVLHDIGIDIDRFLSSNEKNRALYRSLGLVNQATFFDKETWGVDKLRRKVLVVTAGLSPLVKELPDDIAFFGAVRVNDEPVDHVALGEAVRIPGLVPGHCEIVSRDPPGDLRVANAGD